MNIYVRIEQCKINKLIKISRRWFWWWYARVRYNYEKLKLQHKLIIIKSYQIKSKQIKGVTSYFSFVQIGYAWVSGAEEERMKLVSQSIIHLSEIAIHCKRTVGYSTKATLIFYEIMNTDTNANTNINANHNNNTTPISISIPTLIPRPI